MTKPPRKKIGIPLTGKDLEVIEKTSKPKPNVQSATPTVKVTAQPSKSSKPDHDLKATDLRCYIPRKGQFAAALAAQLDTLDPVAKRFISPATVLKDFMLENDEALAELFRKNNSLK